MDAVLAGLTGAFVAAAVYMMLSRDRLRMLLGLVLLGNGVNLLILVAGRSGFTVPPYVTRTAGLAAAPTADPLPQALILTAIVIGFALFAVLAVLVLRASAAPDAEPQPHAPPPLEY